MEGSADEPLQVHAHAADGGVGMQHFVLGPLAFVDDHHVGAAVEVGEGVGNARHFFTKGVVQGEQMVDLRVKRRLGWGASSRRCYGGEGSGREAEVGGGC